MSDTPLLEMRDIVKTFPGGVTANDEVTLSVAEGEIHGLLGENGAGKSTLMRILYGLYAADAGEIRFHGEPVVIESPQQAIELGIGMVHQHFKLIPRLSVAENVILGSRVPHPRFQRAATTPEGVVDQLLQSRVVRELGRRVSIGRSTAREEVATLAEQYGIDIDVDGRMSDLDVGEQQRVEILKALYRDIDLLILDEPTATLTPNQTKQLFGTLRRLVEEELSIIFITHKLKEVMTITDRVTILKDGQNVDTVETAETTQAALARKMVGRDVVFTTEKADLAEIGAPVLTATRIEVDDNRGRQALRGINITIHEGEVVGIAGVSGNGQRELVECLSGLQPPTAGSIKIGGDAMGGKGPAAFLDAGVGYVPEDRLKDGCAPGLSVMQNAILRDYRSSKFGSGNRLPILDYDAARRYTERLVDEFDIRVSNIDMKAKELSGGNLQKLVLARELSRNPDVLVAHQPTRGVDVGAIEYIRELLVQQQHEGAGILLVSESLDEVSELSDRILVMYEGSIVHETTPAEANREELGLYMTGGKEDDPPDQPVPDVSEQENPVQADGDGNPDRQL